MKKPKVEKPSDREYNLALRYQEHRYVNRDMTDWLISEITATAEKLRRVNVLYELCKYDPNQMGGEAGVNSAYTVKTKLEVYLNDLRWVDYGIQNNERRARQCIRDYETVPAKANRGAKKPRKVS